MANQYIGEIRLFPYTFAPKGWAFCDGQLLSISQNTALFSLLGYNYGGSGLFFALPDLRGKVAIHQGTGFPLAQSGGEVTHILTVPEMPSHTHQANGSSDEANTVVASNNVWALSENLTYNQSGNTPMNLSAISSAGGDQPHNNMQPYLVLHYCIALEGIFPPQN